MSDVDQGRVDVLAEEARAEMARRRKPGEATYRLQFHSDFTFHDAAKIVEYLDDLGITDVYSSPYLTAAPGSKHGYDVTDHRAVSVEVGGTESHDALVGALAARGMGLILDTVPNHMGVLGNENVWWNSVLEGGRASEHADAFDIDWSPSRPGTRPRLLVPMLGETYGHCLEAGELVLERRRRGFGIRYYDHLFPVDLATCGPILRSSGLEPIADFLDGLPPHDDPDPGRRQSRREGKERARAMLAEAPDRESAIAEVVARFDPAALDRLHEAQAYRLAHWRVAAGEINYRRFFDVTSLIALRAEDPAIFEATHALAFDLLGRGMASGLRIDHPDGLRDPKTYLDRLQTAYALAVARHLHGDSAPSWETMVPSLRARFDRDAAGPPLHVVVEKILGAEEELPSDWRCDGTTGYDALNVINGLFVDSSSVDDFTAGYRQFVGDATTYEEQVRTNKLLVLRISFGGELQSLANRLDRIAQADPRARDFSAIALRRALREVIACFPVYRSYITADAISDDDRAFVDAAIEKAVGHHPASSRPVYEFIREVLIGTPTPERREFAARFQQLTSPVMAKGLEDTTFYVYNRLVSLNEVGGEPGRFGVDPEWAHRWFAARQGRYPRSMISLTTHDTKRSEDNRARLNVLSTLPDDWFATVERWSALTERHRVDVGRKRAPDRNEQYLLFQSLVGAWPRGGRDDPGLTARLQAYATKALHEAKVNSSWTDPDLAYDEAVSSYIAAILDPARSSEFLADFVDFQARIDRAGIANSLAQTILRATLPGMTDTYQGTELWDDSLVDPDNRRPVDYARRTAWLAEMKGAEPGLCDRLLAEPDDGRIKLFVLWKLLGIRRANPGLFTEGTYQAVMADRLFAFVRSLCGKSVIVAIPRFATESWGDAILPTPGIGPGAQLRDAITGRTWTVVERGGAAGLPIGEIFGAFPGLVAIPE